MKASEQAFAVAKLNEAESGGGPEGMRDLRPATETGGRICWEVRLKLLGRALVWPAREAFASVSQSRLKSGDTSAPIRGEQQI
ncbi:MAG TPA: hypothetical protein DEA73_04715 [Peptococcaceae bacterium]|nr:hypothetical protein [Peptococcaceae bacterium]